MRIIGIDPGTVICGYGIIELRAKSKELGEKLKNQGSSLHTRDSNLHFVTAGDVKMDRKEGLPQRLLTLHTALKAVITDYKPSSLCIEKIFYHKSIRSAMALGYARGVIMLLAAENDLPLFEYNSTELKMALTGYGRAEKRQVQEMVKRILNIGSQKPGVRTRNSELRTQNSKLKTCLPAGKVQTLSEDATDALALCICHINSSFQLR